MSVGIHPVVLIAGIGAVFALVSIVVACLVRRRAVRVLMIVLAFIFLAPAVFVFLALHPELIDDRFRTYKAFYRDIHEGMTREEVYTALERHYPKDGNRQRPTIFRDTSDRLEFVMNPETSREPNCEGIFMTLKTNHVIQKQYSPD
jgi:hypothetical protein